MAAPVIRLIGFMLPAILNNSCDGDGHVELTGPMFDNCNECLHLFGVMELVCGDSVRHNAVQALLYHTGTAR